MTLSGSFEILNPPSVTAGMSITEYAKFDLNKPYKYPILEAQYMSAKEKTWDTQFSGYVTTLVKTDLSVNSAILHSMAYLTGDISIYDILAMKQGDWINHCKEYHYPFDILKAGIHSIKKKYCDFHMNFGDRIDISGQIYRKRIPCSSWFDSDCADFITNRAISRILNYAWDTPHKSLVFTLDPAGWDMCTWDTIGAFCKLVKDAIDKTINQQFKLKHSRIKGKVSAGIIIIPHTFSSLDPTHWQPHFNVLLSTDGILDINGTVIDISYLDYNLLRKNYKELLQNRFGLYRKGNYQINISEKDRTLSDNSFSDILRYNKRAPISDNDIIEIHNTGIEFTNTKRKAEYLPNLLYDFDTFFHGIMQHMPPKNQVQIHGYGLYHQNHKNFKNYKIAFDSTQSPLSEYEDKTWLWTAYAGRIVAYNSDYLLNNIQDMNFIDSKNQCSIVSLIKEDRRTSYDLDSNKTCNKNTEICRILTPIVYNLKHPPPDNSGNHKNFGFIPIMSELNL